MDSSIEMSSRPEIDEDSDTNKGNMWVLDQRLDQPMDEEAGRLRNMYFEKVAMQIASDVATACRLGLEQQAMERIPAACAMEWSIELEKALRSKKSGEPVKAIERFGPRLCWWSREPEPTKAVHDMFGLVPGEDRLFANAILLCLADAFRLGDRDARLSVVRVFLLELKQRRGKKKCKQYKGILSKARVYNQLELLKRVKIVFDIGDVESRALALVLFGCWADFAKDNVHIRYLILSSLVSTDLLQVKSALFAAGCFCELAGDFASVALEMLINMLTFSETPSVIRLAGVRVFAKMGCSYSIASSAYKIGLKLVLDSTEEDFLVAMLVSLSKIAFKSTLLLSEQVGLLLSFLSRKQTLRMQATALRCLCFVFMGRACHPSLSTRVIKTLFNTLHDTELPSAMQCEALYILHKIFSCGLPSLAEDNMLEFTHLLTVVEKSTPSTISNNLVFRVLVDVSMLFRERKEMQSGEDACSSLLVRIISVITDRIILLVKPLWNLHRPNTLVVQDIRGLFSLLLSLVLKYPDLGVLVLDRIRLFVLELVDIQEGDVVTRQAHVLADKTTDFGAEGSASSREKLLHMVHKFCVTCIGKLSDVGAIKTQIFYQVKLLVECVHQCRVFDYYTHTIFSVLLHSESMWNFAVKDKDSCLDSNLCSSLRSYLVEKEVFSLESANRMLEEIDKWPAYKAGIFAACQGAWVTAAFIFDQLTSKAQRESSSYWLKLLALFTQFESKIQLFIMPQLSSSLVDRSKGLDFAMHFSEKFGESNQRARQNITEPNYSKMLVGVYFSTSKETFESIIKSNKSFCFQRWFLVLRAKVLGTVLDLLNVLEAIPLNQSTGSQKGEVEWLNSLQQITEFSFRLKRLSQEYDLVATSFIDMDSRSSNIMSALALSCSVLAFASGFALFVSNLPASETLKPNDPEKSNSSRGQLIQSLVARLWLIDQETCSNLCQLLEVSGNCHLQPRNKILNIAGEVREILNVCNCVVCGIAGLQKRATGVQNKEILSEVTRDCLVLLLNAITKYLHIPFQVPKYFFKVRPLVGSELFVYHADSRNPIELSVQPGFHLSLNLCFQLKNLPPDLSSHVTKSYCILCSSTSFQESVSNQSSHEQVHMDYEFWETDCIIKQNEKLKCYVTESARKKRHTDKEFGRDDGIVHSFVCFELNDSGQGFSNCLLDVSNFPVGSYRIKWYSCCIDSRGCYRSLLALNAGPMFTVTPPSSVSI